MLLLLLLLLLLPSRKLHLILSTVTTVAEFPTESNALLIIATPILIFLILVLLILTSLLCAVMYRFYGKKNHNFMNIHSTAPAQQIAYNTNYYITVNSSQVTDEANNVPTQHIQMQHQPQLDLQLYETVRGEAVSPIHEERDGEGETCQLTGSEATYSKLNYNHPTQKREDADAAIHRNDPTYQNIRVTDCDGDHDCAEATYSKLECTSATHEPLSSLRDKYQPEGSSDAPLYSVVNKVKKKRASLPGSGTTDGYDI